jgi:hypothetical protein
LLHEPLASTSGDANDIAGVCWCASQPDLPQGKALVETKRHDKVSGAAHWCRCLSRLCQLTAPNPATAGPPRDSLVLRVLRELLTSPSHRGTVSGQTVQDALEPHSR